MNIAGFRGWWQIFFKRSRSWVSEIGFFRTAFGKRAVRQDWPILESETLLGLKRMLFTLWTGGIFILNGSMHIQKIKHFLKKIIHRDVDEEGLIRSLYILALTVGGTAFLLVGWFVFFSQRADSPAGELLFEDGILGEDDCSFQRRLDGVCLLAEESMVPIVAVVIDNHSEARPPSGLSEARVVYEIPVEANFTRFVALYLSDQTIPQVGPVRSVRPYMLDWLEEYGAPFFFHVGGSPETLEAISRRAIADVNEFYQGEYFWRFTKRFAPHNVYTSTTLWQQAMHDMSERATSSLFSPWKFSDDIARIASSDLGERFTVSFVPPTYEATWQYATTTKSYARSQAGTLHRDLDGRDIVADTVIVQRVKTQILDAVGRLGMETIGGGEAFVFRDGRLIEGTWKKDSALSRTIWLDAIGRPIPLKSGRIWIEVLPQNGAIKME